jgi:hypothetical protein
MIASILETQVIPATHLIVYQVRLIYSRLFIVYSLLGYDMILDNEFIEHVPQMIDLLINILCLIDCLESSFKFNDSNFIGHSLVMSSISKVIYLWVRAYFQPKRQLLILFSVL